MIIVQDSVIAAAGLRYEEAVALLQPAEGEIVVRVHDFWEPDDVAGVVAPALVDPDPSSPISRVSSLGTTNMDGDTIVPAPIAGGLNPYHPPRVLPDSGWSVGDVAAAALKTHSTIQVEPDGTVTLTSVFGTKTYKSLSDVVKALNSREF